MPTVPSTLALTVRHMFQVITMRDLCRIYASQMVLALCSAGFPDSAVARLVSGFTGGKDGDDVLKRTIRNFVAELEAHEPGATDSVVI